MIKQVKKFCLDNKLVSEGDRVIIACSGGSDSLAMLDIFLTLRESLGIRVAAAHYEHGIRGEESKADARFVEEFCKERGVEFYIGYGDVPSWARSHGMSLETAARECRYEFLQSVSRKLGGALIAMAHHRDDQAETVMMHILQGSGLTGLAGMRPKRDNIIRPLLFLSKEQLVDYCYSNGLQARVDRTNEVADCTRNRIRLKLMPNLASTYNRAITDGLCHMAQIAAVDGDFIQSCVDAVWPDLVAESEGRWSVSCAGFKAQHAAVQRRILQRLVAKAGGQGVIPRNFGYVHITLLMDFIAAEKTGSYLSLPGDVQVSLSYGEISFYKKLAGEGYRREVRKFSDKGVKLSVPGRTETPEFGICFKAEIREEKPEYGQQHIVLDYDKCTDDFYVRRRAEGDRIQLSGGTKKLKDFFIDRKIPREQRDRMPILCLGKNIVWVAGCQQAMPARVDEETKRFLVISCCGKDRDKGEI